MEILVFLWRNEHGGPSPSEIAEHRLGQQPIFVRQTKTRTSKVNPGKETVLSLMPEALDIIKKWGQYSHDQNEFVFPELNLGMDEK
ncbi:hypothetical protein ACN9ML_07515 [Dyadobacter endophyticus]|uniref:hypothetical protein n=1 Tax=Dyadobacter endophyticus TaxID=1749036 RepID=UPI003CF035E8